MESSASPPPAINDKRLVNTYDYTIDPTDAHISEFVDTTTATRRQVARFQIHNNQTTTGVVKGYAAKGVRATSVDLRYQKNLLYLRNTWPQGVWHPDGYLSNAENPSRDLVSGMNNSQESQGWLTQAINASKAQVFGAKIPNQALKLLRDHHHQQGKEEKPKVKSSDSDPELARADSKAESDAVVPPALSIERDLSPVSLAVVVEEALRPPTPAPPPLIFFPVDPEEAAAASPKPRISHSPPPLVDEGDESECSVDGVISHMLSRPGMPVAPMTSKHRAIVAEAEARLRKKEAQKAKREGRAVARKKEAAAVAAVDKDKVASIYAAEAARSARRVGRERFAGLLSAAKRNEIERDMAITVKKRVKKIL
ncbi:hypothetical protein LY78DRAFT_740564 [Colletotrichum sublineola]|uniref:Uncharacterized protein n=1 Tax=Colletotrichum sublineola TaxID=1173701 RepID=A0A066X3C2_COLSU|nr:hypothetical protein LY78DRAFT_740564 [Colletotrichum sublineola]KDN63472.1 hypothetical protein CSUB01_08554 [Colletotrichum sublineola]